MRAGHFESFSSETGLSPPVRILLLTVPRWYFFGGSFVLFLYYVSHAFASAHWCPVVTWWFLVVSISDLCPLSYFHTVRIVLNISAALVQWPGHRMHTN